MRTHAIAMGHRPLWHFAYSKMPVYEWSVAGHSTLGMAVDLCFLKSCLVKQVQQNGISFRDPFVMYAMACRGDFDAVAVLQYVNWRVMSALEFAAHPGLDTILQKEWDKAISHSDKKESGAFTEFEMPPIGDILTEIKAHHSRICVAVEESSNAGYNGTQEEVFQHLQNIFAGSYYGRSPLYHQPSTDTNGVYKENASSPYHV